MSGVRRVVNFFFQPRYLLYTNTACSGLLMGLGDCAVQNLQSLMTGKEHCHNWKQTGRMTVIGVLLGPINHAWFTFLDRILPSVNAKTVAKKILLDQTIGSPVFAFSFFMGSNMLEGKSAKNSWEIFRAKFWDVYKADWMVWPAAQAINFRFVPTQFRVLYVCHVTLWWDAFLCYMHQKKLNILDETPAEKVASKAPAVSEKNSLPLTALGSKKSA